MDLTTLKTWRRDALIDNLRGACALQGLTGRRCAQSPRVRSEYCTLCEAAERLSDLLALQEKGWQPIETAPKDGTVIVVSRIDCHYDVSFVIWRDGRWEGPDTHAIEFVPRHWTLPAPPVDRGRGDE